MTHTVRGDFDQYFTSLGTGLQNILNNQLATSFRQDCGFHLEIPPYTPEHPPLRWHFRQDIPIIQNERGEGLS